FSDDRRIVAGAGCRPAYPALLGNEVSAVAADAARRQPPILPSFRRRLGAQDPPAPYGGRLYDPGRAEAASLEAGAGDDYRSGAGRHVAADAGGAVAQCRRVPADCSSESPGRGARALVQLL